MGDSIAVAILVIEVLVISDVSLLEVTDVVLTIAVDNDESVEAVMLDELVVARSVVLMVVAIILPVVSIDPVDAIVIEVASAAIIVLIVSIEVNSAVVLIVEVVSVADGESAKVTIIGVLEIVAVVG